MSSLTLVDQTQLQINNDYVIMDDTYEFRTTVEDYSALAELSAKLTDDNLKVVKQTDQYGSVTTYNNFTVSTPIFYIVEDTGYELSITIRLKEKPIEEVQMEAVVEVAQEFDDEKALSVKNIYPQWDTLVGKKVKQGTKCIWYGRLYKTLQPDEFLVQKQYEPGATGTEALYECIDEDHTGSYDDPIPYDGNMTLEQGKCYSQDGVVYMCINGSGIAVYEKLEYLSTFVVQYVYAEGTYEDPIQWFGSGIIEKNKYYTQDGVIYKAIADSSIAVFGDLSVLGVYVQECVPGTEDPTDAKGNSPDDPIEYSGGIALESNKYYIQNGIVYFCVVATDGEVDAPLSELTDNVIKYEEGGTEEPEEPPKTGSGESKEDPIVWSKGSKLYNGSYYIDKDVVYLCIRDSGIELYYDLADLISGGYVKVVE